MKIYKYENIGGVAGSVQGGAAIRIQNVFILNINITIKIKNITILLMRGRRRKRVHGLARVTSYSYFFLGFSGFQSLDGWHFIQDLVVNGGESSPEHSVHLVLGVVGRMLCIEFVKLVS